MILTLSHDCRQIDNETFKHRDQQIRPLKEVTEATCLLMCYDIIDIMKGKIFALGLGFNLGVEASEIEQDIMKF